MIEGQREEEGCRGKYNPYGKGKQRVSLQKRSGGGAGLLCPDTSHTRTASCKARSSSQLLAYVSSAFVNCKDMSPGIQTQHPPKTSTHIIIATSLLPGHNRHTCFINPACLTFWQSGGTVPLLKSRARSHLH